MGTPLLSPLPTIRCWVLGATHSSGQSLSTPPARPTGGAGRGHGHQSAFTSCPPYSPRPYPGRHRFPVWTATMPHLFFWSHPRSPKYLQIRMIQFLGSKLQKPAMPPAHLWGGAGGGHSCTYLSDSQEPSWRWGTSKRTLELCHPAAVPLFSGPGGEGLATSQ